ARAGRDKHPPADATGLDAVNTPRRDRAAGRAGEEDVMPEQRTAASEVEQSTSEQPSQQSAEPDAKTSFASKAPPETKGPSSTRELRDAQRRPPIRAEGA